MVGRGNARKEGSWVRGEGRSIVSIGRVEL